MASGTGDCTLASHHGTELIGKDLEEEEFDFDYKMYNVLDFSPRNCDRSEFQHVILFRECLFYGPDRTGPPDRKFLFSKPSV